MESDALNAMFAHLESIDVLPVYFPNIEQDNKGNAEPNDSHLRVFVLPIDVNNDITICGQKGRYRWLMQVSVFVRDGVGQIKAAEYIDQLRSYTLPDSLLIGGSNEFRVVGIGQTAPAIQSDGWFNYPVTFSIEIIK